jgi:hypothetical protein
MSIKSNLAKATAQVICKREEKLSFEADKKQLLVFKQLIAKSKDTRFGIDHQFNKIKNYQDFKDRVPVRDYEGHKGYIDRILLGEENVLWPGRPKYLAKTSGTTSGAKYIPISRASISNHINSARNALFSYAYHRPKTRIFDGKMLFLSGSPILEEIKGIPVGRLSGIVNHEIPPWFKNAKLPSHEINLIEPWEMKVDKIIEELLQKDLRVVSGIPPWLQMLFERLLETTGKSSVLDVFPNLELYIHGGVNYEPYREKIAKLVGGSLELIETYPASEGFLAYQDNPDIASLRINSHSGIFYEFIPLKSLGQPDPPRFALDEVETGEDYAIILSTNAGLWVYLIGDVVRFDSIRPYKLRVTGRVSQYISAFGEHVIAHEVDSALSKLITQYNLKINEFTVAPNVNPKDGSSPHHEWFIEFDQIPEVSLKSLEQSLDDEMKKLNTYYKDLVGNGILSILKIRLVKPGGFKKFMISINQYGEQFKVKRLANDRKIADQLFELGVLA